MGAGCPDPLQNRAAIRGKFCTSNFRTLGENAGPCLLFVPWEKFHPCKHLSLYLYGVTCIHRAPNLLIHTHMPEVILNVGSSPFYPWVVEFVVFFFLSKIFFKKISNDKFVKSPGGVCCSQKILFGKLWQSDVRQDLTPSQATLKLRFRGRYDDSLSLS